MDTWHQVIAAFAGGLIIAILGNLLFPWWREHWRRPKLTISLQDDLVLSQNKQIIYHRLLVTNEGKIVARRCVATVRIKNATKENILEEAQGFKAILKPEDFGLKLVLEDPQLLCWSIGNNPGVLSLNPGISYAVEALAFDYGQQVNPKNPPVVKSMIIPSEMGWNPPRAILKPSRYVLWVQVHGENCKPSKAVRFWVRRVGGVNDDHLEVSFTP